MSRRPRHPLQLEELLAAVEAAPPVAAAEVFREELGAALDAREVSFLIADYSGQALIRLDTNGGDGTDGDAARPHAEAVGLEGTPAGRALNEQQVIVITEGAGTRLFAPVTSRGEAIGILELALDGPPDDEALAAVRTAAHALAFVIIANRRFTDLFEWGQRSLPLSLEAEIQHRLLPGSYTLEGGQFTLAGWLEPAGDIGGDTFDFSLERNTLHLSISDAMGHTLNAALLATVLVGALRNARRRGVTLDDQARSADAALTEHTDDDAFVTGQLVRVDLPTGTAQIVNAGHPAPVRLRGGRAERIPLDADLPFGTPLASPYRLQALPLQAGDRLVFLTDGMLERNARHIDVLSMLESTAGLHPRQAIQEITRAVVAACGGDLRDDATLLCLDWHGGPPRPRHADAGADL